MSTSGQSIGDAASEEALRGARVLVLDDEATIRSLLETTAELQGELSGKRSGPAGWVRVSVSAVLAQAVIAPSLTSLVRRHPGLHLDIAADDRMAIEAARDTYTRRMEGVSLWVVRSSEIVASDPGEAAALFEPAADKVYRHPTFYRLPDEVDHM